MLVTSCELKGPASHGGSASCGMTLCVEAAAMGAQSLLGLWCLGCAGDGDELAASPSTEAGVLQLAEELELEVAGLLDCNDALPSSAYESLRTRLAEESLRQAFVRTMSQYAFCAAAESGNIALLRIAIDSGVRPDAVRTSAGETPLICAARRGKTDAVQLLLDSGTSVHRRGSSKIITRSGTADFSAITYSMTALHVAVDGNYQRCARLLIDSGARVDSRFRSGFNHAGYSALDLAALRGNIECLRLLIDHGANVGSFGGSFRRTALHHAVIEDQRGCMRVLLDRGANREARDLDGWTPLGTRQTSVRLSLSHTHALGADAVVPVQSLCVRLRRSTEGLLRRHHLRESSACSELRLTHSPDVSVLTCFDCSLFRLVFGMCTRARRHARARRRGPAPDRSRGED